MKTLTRDGRTIAYRQTGGSTGGADAAGGAGETDAAGAATSVLYVHGSGATHRLWVHQYGADRPAPAVALDLSGHGNSDDFDGDGDVDRGGDVDRDGEVDRRSEVRGRAALDAYADDVVAVARATRADVLVGNSLGGAVVLHVALERTFAPEGLILTDTGARLPVNPDLLEWLSGDFERAVEFLHRPDMFFHDPEPEWVERSKDALRETGPAVTERDFLVCDAFDVRERLDEVDLPALVVHGEHDRLTPPEWNQYLAEHLPQAELVEIPGAAHLPMVERPATFNRAATEFLGRV